MLSNLRKLLVTGLLVGGIYQGSGTTAQAEWYCGQAWEACVTVPGCTFEYWGCFETYCWTLCSCDSGVFHGSSCVCEGGSC